MKIIRGVLQNDYAILLNIFKSSNGLNAYTLFKRSKISYPLFMNCIRKLQNKKLIEIDKEDHITITESAVCFILQRGFKKDNNADWKKAPEIFLKNKSDINTLYIPNISLLDSKEFSDILKIPHRD